MTSLFFTIYNLAFTWKSLIISVYAFSTAEGAEWKSDQSTRVSSRIS
jgi:hypothetical protein